MQFRADQDRLLRALLHPVACDRAVERHLAVEDLDHDVVRVDARVGN